jgi:hypothetical protein
MPGASYGPVSRCQLCGRPAQEVDHIRPRMARGTDDPSNLRPLCRACHEHKTRADDTAEASAKEFAEDAKDMAGEGYYPASETWLGPTLLVADEVARASGTRTTPTSDRLSAREWVMAGFWFTVGVVIFAIIASLIVGLVAFLLIQVVEIAGVV